MEERKHSVLKRLTNGFGKGVGYVFQAAFVCVLLVFWAGSCVKDGRNFLSCTGIYKPDPTKEVQVRPFDSNSEKDGRLVASLAKVARAAGMDLDKIRVAIAVDPHINAMTVGTDTFVFCEGLHKLSPEALDAVMAHEVGHAIKGHSDRSSTLLDTVNTVTGIAGSLLGSDDETKEEVASWARAVAFAPYSRSQELEADSVAVELLKEAGYPLNGVEVMCEALESITKQEGDVGGGFLSTHPSNSDRIHSIRQNSRNVRGPLTKSQYWAAMTTTWSFESESPYKHLDTLKARARAIGEREALAEIVEQGGQRIDAARTILAKTSRIVPPPDYEEMHAEWIAVLKGLQTVIEHQIEAAKKHSLKGALAAETEAVDLFARNAELWQQFEVESKKYPTAGG